MSETKYDEDAAFARVMQAVEAAEAKGYTITPVVYRDDETMCCCPIGAFGVEAEIPEGEPNSMGISIAAELGIVSGHAKGDRGFAYGFDRAQSIPYPPARGRSYRLGQRVARALKERSS